LFDRRHPSVPTCARDTPARTAAVKDGPSGPPRQRREASLTAASTTANFPASGCDLLSNNQTIKKRPQTTIKKRNDA